MIAASRTLLAALVLASLAFPLKANDNVTEIYAERELTYSGGKYENHVFRYRLMAPPAVEAGKKYPLVLFLHGAGERGDDNRDQLKYLPEQMAQPEWRQRFPCYLLAPQCPETGWWVKLVRPSSEGGGSAPSNDELLAVENMLEAVLAELPIDRTRVYLTGLSMGGFGSWELASRHPDWFAAVAPICGGGDPSRAARLVGVPIWAFHGDADPVVPVARSRAIIEAIRAAGGEPRYSELEGVKHDSWTPAYSDPAGVISWMFDQVNLRLGESS